jgi:anti-anti-sigma factor
MNIQQETHEGVLVLRPVGRLDSASSPELEKVVVEQLDKGVKRLVFDFSELDYISSAGLRVVLMAGKKLRATGGKLGLAGMRDMVREVFEMSGFLALFSVAPNLDDALKLV